MLDFLKGLDVDNALEGLASIHAKAGNYEMAAFYGNQWLGALTIKAHKMIEGVAIRSLKLYFKKECVPMWMIITALLIFMKGLGGILWPRIMQAEHVADR